MVKDAPTMIYFHYINEHDTCAELLAVKENASTDTVFHRQFFK